MQGQTTLNPPRHVPPARVPPPPLPPPRPPNRNPRSPPPADNAPSRSRPDRDVGNDTGSPTNPSPIVTHTRLRTLPGSIATITRSTGTLVNSASITRLPPPR